MILFIVLLSLLSLYGCTVKPTDADDELYVAVSVTVVGFLTDPIWIWN